MIKIELTEKQANVISKALDVFSRCHAGQYYMALTEALPPTHLSDFNHEVVRGLLNQVKEEIFTDLSSLTYYGIHSQEIGENAKIAYDLHQVIRHYLAWKSHPEGDHMCDFDKPFRSSQTEELASIEGKTISNDRS